MNGTYLNGTYMNGTYANGACMTGTYMNDWFNMNGTYMNEWYVYVLGKREAMSKGAMRSPGARIPHPEWYIYIYI